MQTVVARQVHRGRKAKLLEQRECHGVKVDRTVIERERDRPRRQRPVVQARDGFAKGKDRIAAIPKERESRPKQLGRDVELGIPKMLVGRRYAVVAEDQQATSTP